jgi:hypothetical protein
LTRSTWRGALLNFQGAAIDPQQVAKVWSPEVHRRLAELKRTYDPGQVFRFGHLIA